MTNREWDSLHFALVAVSSLHWIIPCSIAGEWTVYFFYYPTVSSYYDQQRVSVIALYFCQEVTWLTSPHLTPWPTGCEWWGPLFCQTGSSHDHQIVSNSALLLPCRLYILSNTMTNRKWVTVPFILSDSLIIQWAYLMINSLWVFLLSVKNFSSHSQQLVSDRQCLSWDPSHHLINRK